MMAIILHSMPGCTMLFAHYTLASVEQVYAYWPVALVNTPLELALLVHCRMTAHCQCELQLARQQPIQYLMAQNWSAVGYEQS